LLVYSLVKYYSKISFLIYNLKFGNKRARLRQNQRRLFKKDNKNNQTFKKILVSSFAYSKKKTTFFTFFSLFMLKCSHRTLQMQKYFFEQQNINVKNFIKNVYIQKKTKLLPLKNNKLFELNCYFYKKNTN
jgi:hypothetical protein